MRNINIKTITIKGFTLIELMVALVILTILMGFAIPEVVNQINQSKLETQKNNLKEIKKALDQYYADRGRYPMTLKSLTETTHPYFSEVPIDPVTGSADWEVREKEPKTVWYKTSKMNYPGAPAKTWGSPPPAESSIFDLRARPAQN